MEPTKEETMAKIENSILNADAIYRLVVENCRIKDRFIGTLMMLAYQGIISDGRARELIEMDTYTWRAECARVIKQVSEPESNTTNPEGD